MGTIVYGVIEGTREQICSNTIYYKLRSMHNLRSTRRLLCLFIQWHQFHSVRFNGLKKYTSENLSLPHTLFDGALWKKQNNFTALGLFHPSAPLKKSPLHISSTYICITPRRTQEQWLINRVRARAFTVFNV